MTEITKIQKDTNSRKLFRISSGVGRVAKDVGALDTGKMEDKEEGDVFLEEEFNKSTVIILSESEEDLNKMTEITNIQKDKNSRKLFRATSGMEGIGDDVEAVFFWKRSLGNSSPR